MTSRHRCLTWQAFFPPSLLKTACVLAVLYVQRVRITSKLLAARQALGFEDQVTQVATLVKNAVFDWGHNVSEAVGVLRTMLKRLEVGRKMLLPVGWRIGGSGALVVSLWLARLPPSTEDAPVSCPLPSSSCFVHNCWCSGYRRPRCYAAHRAHFPVCVLGRDSQHRPGP